MKCKICNKEIDENEIFCDDCRIKLKVNSSKRNLDELESLIEENQKLNELEITKELPNIEDLELNDNKILGDDIKPLETREELNKENYEIPSADKIDTKKEAKQKKSKKKVIIILLIFIVIIFCIFSFILINRPKKEVKEEIIDYEKVINEYGNRVEKTVRKLYDTTSTVPTFKEVLENLTYKKYDVTCLVHEIYEDLGVYLDKCKVDNKKVKFSFGSKEEEKKEGKIIDIYVSNSDNHSIYSDTKYNASFEKNGSITCLSKYCEYINAYNKYVLIREDKRYYLYDYENNTINFGPFDMENEYTGILEDNLNIYGILYIENGIKNIYNLKLGKAIKNIKGTVEEDQVDYGISVLLKYNLLVLKNSSKYDFININTGNVSFSINSNIKNIIEDTENKIVYITTYSKSIDKFKVYNSNGKLLFGGEEYNMINISSNNIIVSNENIFKVYDSKINLRISSKKYDKVLGLYDDFIVTYIDGKVKIVDLSDKEMASFDVDLKSGIYYFHDKLSGWDQKNKEKGIYLIIENKDIPYGTKGSGLECYYIPSTTESGITETTGIAGYSDRS